MKRNLKYGQWLVFLLITWLPLALLAADAGTPAALPALPALSLTPTRDFAYTEPEFETLRDTESIDGRSITALAQDARGLIWIGTQAGLVRYDGYRFRKFIPNATDPFSVAGYFVSSLLTTKDGRLWVGTLSDGISVFDPASERFEHFRHDEKAPHSVGGGRIWALANDDERGGMWIANDQGLDFLPTGSRRFVHFRHNTDLHSLMEGRVRSLLLDKTGRLWVGGGNGLQRMNKDGKHFETVVSDKEIHILFQAQDGKLWLGTRNHGAAWLMPDVAPSQASWLPLAQLSHPWITAIEQVESDQILLATYGGGIIVVAASDGQVLQTLRHDPALAASLAADTLGPLLQDRAGSLWVGTWGRGLQRMNTDNAVRRLLRHSPNRPNGLSHPDVRIMLELADGRLLIGSRGNGIDIFDRQRGLIDGYRTDQGRTGALPDATIYALAQSRDGSVWVGTQLAGVVRQLAGQTAWVPVPGLPNKKVNKLFASRDGSVWAATDRGVARWRPSEQAPLSAGQENPHARFEALMDEQGKAMETAVSALAEDGQGRIWIGTNNGLWLYKPGAKGPIRIHTEPEQADGLISNFILCLLVDSHDRLWVATDKRLERLKSLNGNHARFEHGGNRLDMAQGGSLLEDQQGRIWTELSVINPANMTLPPLPFDPGELGAHLITSYGKTRDGLLLFGGTEGMAIIDPARFKAYEYAPPLAVTGLKINGKAVAPGSLINPLAQTRPDTQANAAASLTLTPDQRNFSIEFAALDYSEPKKNRYQYRLQGYEKDWISTDADNRSATYGNLWPGLYTLQVRGSNRLGDWSKEELGIAVRVLPAWWQTWWFGLVLLLCLTAFIAALVQTRTQTRTRYLRQRQHELEQMVDERTSELRQKQAELVDANQELNHANHELHDANLAVNQVNAALNQSNEALNEANADLALSVETLRQLGDIGREITAHLDADIVFQSLYLYVGGLLNAPAMTIYRMNAAATMLDAVFGRENDQVMQMRNIELDSITSNVARAVRERHELLLHYDRLDYSTHIPGTRQMLTALFAPLIVDDKVLGVMSIQSDKPHAYGERERLIFRTLTAYGAIALANAAAVAALHQAQGQLVQQEKMASLGGLVAGIAHEINTPLGTTLVAISGASDALQTLQSAAISGRLNKSVLDSSTAEGLEYTALALKTATRAADLITLFKTISVDAESDRPMEIDLANYLREMATLVHTQLMQNSNMLEVTAAPGLRIHIVSEALTEALSRILVNVVDHGFAEGRTGTLRIHAQPGEEDGSDEVIITISDDGLGIAPEHLPKVFDPFFTTKSGMHGHVGLGLHVAYNHVTERLKGKIRVTSTLGEGTCVEIRLKKT